MTPQACALHFKMNEKYKNHKFVRSSSSHKVAPVQLLQRA
jgi:hypothetical protein